MLNKLKKIRIKKRLIVLFLAIYLIYTLYQVPDIMAENDFPLILGAHRGNSVDYFENSIPAIKNALEDPKYNFIEIDIQYTKDKQIVVFHDKSLWRMQKQWKKIPELTYQELSEISTYPIPLYDKIMDLIGNKKKINIEIKSQGNFEDDKKLVDFVIADSKERKVINQILLSSISTEIVKYVTENYPELKTGKIYLIHPITYLHFSFIVEDFYQEMEEMGADYLMLHGINMKNYQLLTKLKPKNQTLVFWYFNDQMLIMQKDPTDLLW